MLGIVGFNGQWNFGDEVFVSKYWLYWPTAGGRFDGEALLTLPQVVLH